MAELNRIRERYENAGQGHVLEYYDTLSSDELKKKAFLEQLSSISVEHLSDYLTKAKAMVNHSTGNITPFSGSVVSSDDENSGEWKKIGMNAIQNGHVAALVLAGGQGTRLGYNGPKGCFNIGLPSKKTLFQLLSERIMKLQSDTEGKLSLYVMTSPLNHDETVSFFEKHNNFGIVVNFFPQGMLPCLNDEDGKIILEGKEKVSMAPDGNGGIYTALENTGMLNQMQAAGVKYLHVFSIDNALCRPADPIFVGYCISVQADCGNKVLWKKNAHEKVGVMAEQDGKPCILEYSDLSKEMAESKKDGKLLFGAANICNHFYTLNFIRDRVLPNMANLYHVAHKKIPYFDGKSLVTPTSPNGYKLESFIFDVFPLSEKMAIMNVTRENEFAPVKNATGSDSPESACRMVSDFSKRMMIEAEAILDGNQNDSICEVSPLTSYAGEGLKEYSGRRISCPFSL
mmetsp:Transcript_32986/g.49831  ORF Transcript_32986/g.49831 Transcript_32986/m.49831 type:complete len:457 (+) Transcript_32986:184-1554(+)